MTHRRTRLNASAAALALILVALPLLAQEGHGEPEHGAAPEAGLLDPVLSTMVWSVLIFVAVLLILRKFAWGPILKALDERERKISESLEAAERMRADQEKFRAEQEQLFAAARKEATEIVAEGKRDAEAVKEKIVHDARTQAESLKTRAIGEIDRAKDLAVVEIHERAVGLSIAIAEKLLGHAVDAADQEKLVQQTISQYEKRN
jgi:F-type H+-transporting ATPase subunit b